MRQILSVAVIILSLAASLATLPKAYAQYSLCNKTSYTVRAAIGYVSDDRVASRGWWPLKSGECKIVLTDKVVPGRYFVYGEAIDGHKGEKRTWSGETKLCVKTDGYFNQLNQEVCRNDPMAQRGFKDIEVEAASSGTWTTDFVEATNYTIYSAEVAGVQRLLSDIGFPIKHIDGTMGRNTRRAIAEYRKKRGLNERNGIDEQLIDSLITEANTLDAKLGFFYCNKANAEVWGAIAYPTDETYRSQGWWRLDPGQCVKVLKGKLEFDHYYVYGVMSNGDSDVDMVLAGGDKELCVNDVVFELDNKTSCADQDLVGGVFKRVEIGGSPAATYDFLPDAFIVPPTPEEAPEAPAEEN